MEERRVWIDTGSGPGWEGPVSDLPRMTPPARMRLRLRSIGASPVLRDRSSTPSTEPVPRDVEIDTLLMVLARHTTGPDGICSCDRRAGEFTGRCWHGRVAIKRLTEIGALIADEGDGD